MKTSDSNKLIADFIGYKKYDNDYFISLYNEVDENGETKLLFSKDELKFHRSWEWFLPAIQKIYACDHNSDELLRKFSTVKHYYDKYSPDNSNFYPLYNAVVAFINTYNDGYKQKDIGNT